MWLNCKKTERQNTLAQKRTALTDAVLGSDYDDLRQIVASGADPNEFDDFRMTPLLWAIMRGDITAVKLLFENGADPTLTLGLIPPILLFWSAEDDWGFVEIAALLRSYGAVK